MPLLLNSCQIFELAFSTSPFTDPGHGFWNDEVEIITAGFSAETCTAYHAFSFSVLVDNPILSPLPIPLAPELLAALGTCAVPFFATGGIADLNSGATVYSGAVKNILLDTIDRFGSVNFQSDALQFFLKSDGSLKIKDADGVGFEPASAIGGFLRSLFAGEQICFSVLPKPHGDYRVKVYFAD